MGMNNKRYIFITFFTNSLNRDGETKNDRYNIMIGGIISFIPHNVCQKPWLKMPSGIETNKK